MKKMSVSTFICTVKSSDGERSIRSFNWTTVPVQVYEHQRRIDLLSDSATGGGDVPVQLVATAPAYS